jgi:hypothetical protein
VPQGLVGQGKKEQEEEVVVPLENQETAGVNFNPPAVLRKRSTTAAEFSAVVRAPGWGAHNHSRPSLTRCIVLLNVWEKHARPFQAFLRGQRRFFGARPVD